jgi:hypothetical protein
MKKLILFLSVITLSYSCSSDDSNSSNSSNSFSNSMDYEFTITINGEVHKVKGNTINGIPQNMSSPTQNLINNRCDINSSGVSKTVMLLLSDITESNYISGQNIQCMIVLPSQLIGINQANITLNGPYLSTLYTDLGAISSAGFSTTSGIISNTSTLNILPINITDLGTSTLYPQSYPLPLYNFGETVKGNYSGTIYLASQLISSGINYNIPVQLSIDFKALRMY